MPRPSFLSLIYGNIDMFALFYYESLFLPQKVATGTAYACLRPIERSLSSGARARSQKVPGLRMFPYAFLLRELKLIPIIPI